jgi:adenylate kinase family enzyme
VKRVAVVGCGGAGKSTFAKRLNEVTGLPLYHLDQLHWRPGWIAPPENEWRRTQQELAAQEEWIIDGNYGKEFEIRFARADTVIVLALPRRVCIRRVVWRMMTNWHHDVQATGCPEHVDFEFLHWLWRFPYDARPRLDAALARFQGSFELVELKTTREVRNYFKIGLQR